MAARHARIALLLGALALSLLAAASGPRDARAGYCAIYSEVVGNDVIAGCKQGAAWVRVVGTCRRISNNAPFNFYGPWVWSYNDQTHSFYECGPGWYVSGAYGQRR